MIEGHFSSKKNKTFENFSTFHKGDNAGHIVVPECMVLIMNGQACVNYYIDSKENACNGSLSIWLCTS